MKHIISQYQPEESKFFCDKHSDRECFSELQIISGYGSDFDMQQCKIHLCDECLKEMYKYIKCEFYTGPKEVEI